MDKKKLIRILALALALILAAGVFITPALATETEEISLSEYYSSADFEDAYTYTGDDLGATWTAEKTSFRVWAPTASAVTVNLYASGTAGTDDLTGQLPMTADANGTWTAEQEGDLNGVYYTYSVEIDGVVTEACDPYARATGVNGQRAMVIDLDSTDPEGWENDKDPHYGNPITDAIIYELHVRDLSSDPSSGIENAGKFLGLIEEGTTNSAGQPTGLDHIKSLNITHLHLLPSYDYGSVDESTLELNDFNWGYDPVNYNVPEGSYSTDPYNGEVRVKEFKQMVQGLHNNGISVIMDVVYNHVYNAEEFCFNKIVPQFFSRVGKTGFYSAGSGCGNDTASERAMVHKYIVDSVTYWADEYHIDGFRFDLAGLIDTETMNDVIEEVHKTHPNVIFYCEGWTMTTYPTKSGYEMTTQRNSTLVPEMAYFNDTCRDAIRGSNSNNYETGYLGNGGGFASKIWSTFTATVSWCKSPTQTINYASCHDGYTLYDRITMSTRKQTEEQRIRMNNLAAAIVMMSQGVPFIHAGEEMLRTKVLEDGSFDHNSYDSPDSVNSFKWDDLNDETYQTVKNYYAGLAAFRQAHPALRMTTAEEIAEHITVLKNLEGNTTAFEISAGANGEENNLMVIFNPAKESITMELPAGNWDVYVSGQTAGTEVLETISGTANIEALSALVLVQDEIPPEAPTETVPTDTAPGCTPNKGNPDTWVIWAAVAAAVAIVAVIAVVAIAKKRKN